MIKSADKSKRSPRKILEKIPATFEELVKAVVRGADDKGKKPSRPSS